MYALVTNKTNKLPRHVLVYASCCVNCETHDHDVHDEHNKTTESLHTTGYLAWLYEQNDVLLSLVNAQATRPHDAER